MIRAATVSGRGNQTTTLGDRLRRESRGAHLAAEAAFDLPRRLASMRGYGEALLVLDGFHRACAPALAMVADRLPPALRDGPERRRARLRADLETFGCPETAPALAPLPADDEGRALGVWYVHEGAALGGLLIAAEIRRRLPQALPAATFFAGEGRATAARWRDFQAALDDWDDGAGGERVVAGAHATFAMLTVALQERSR